MKCVFTLLLLASISLAAPNLAIVVDRPAIESKDAFGDPTRKSEKSADWSKDEWSWTLHFEDRRTRQATLDGTPKGVTFDSLEKMIEAIGFTKAKGWTIGKPFKRGILDCAFVTHKDRGIFLVKATPGDTPDTWPVVNVHAPGADS